MLSFFIFASTILIKNDIQKIREEIKNRLPSRFILGKIIFFGSHARGEANRKSDIDLLLIGKVNYNRYKIMTDALRCLWRINCAFDIMILTSREFEENKNIPGTIAGYAFREGKVIYER